MATLVLQVVRPSTDIGWYPISREELDLNYVLFREVDITMDITDDQLTLTRRFTGSSEVIEEINNLFDDPASPLYGRHAYFAEHNMTWIRTIE